MEKITLTFEGTKNGNDGDITDKFTMSFENEDGIMIDDFADRLEQFALAIGYAPETLQLVFKERNSLYEEE